MTKTETHVTESDDGHGNIVQTETTITRTYPYITLDHKTAEQMADHISIMEKCENGVVYTVEGNSGDVCRKRSYPVGSSVIYDYAIPAY